MSTMKKSSWSKRRGTQDVLRVRVHFHSPPSCFACVQTTLQVGPDESSSHYCCVHWPVARCSQEVEERRMSLVPPFFWCEEHSLTLSLTPHIPHPSSLTLTPHITPTSLTPLSSLIPNSLHPSPLTFLTPLFIPHILHILHYLHPSQPSPLTPYYPDHAL